MVIECLEKGLTNRNQRPEYYKSECVNYAVFNYL